ncbi:hypothetical protein ACFOHM_11190, partial [Microbaculum marinum]|uniref:hypothetical protein n=1 Tax=Microbaculum marinum TaxID=1764581 RepID=UPI00360D0B61
MAPCTFPTLDVPGLERRATACANGAGAGGGAGAMDQWANFFLGQVGASAALGGLLFVAASLNLPRILQYPGLPERALAALALLLGILVVSSLMLVPGQPLRLIGAGGLAAGLLLG